jgi:hypothetical protein
MDASVLLICLAMGQASTREFSPPAAQPPIVQPPIAAPGQFQPAQYTPYTPAYVPAQYAPQSRISGEPTPAEPALAPPASSRNTLAPRNAPSQQTGESEVVPLHTLPQSHFGQSGDAPQYDVRSARTTGRSEYPAPLDFGEPQPLAEQAYLPQETAAHAAAAAYNDPVAAPPSAAALLTYALQPQPTSVPGKPVALKTAIERANDRASLVRAIKAYWQLALAAADHNHASEELSFLSELPVPAMPHERAMLESAIAAARARQAEAELALVAAQQDLSEAAPTITSQAPLPSDPPFVGVYRTNFAAIFANKTVPPGLKRIDRTLPVLQRLIDARATAVNKERSALQALTDAYERGQAPLTQLLESFLQLRQQQIAFLAAVRDYNYSIADYAVSVFTPDLGRDAVVSMLIERPSDDAGRSILSPRREAEPVRETLPAASPNEQRAPVTAQQPAPDYGARPPATRLTDSPPNTARPATNGTATTGVTTPPANSVFPTNPAPAGTQPASGSSTLGSSSSAAFIPATRPAPSPTHPSTSFPQYKR